MCTARESIFVTPCREYDRHWFRWHHLMVCNLPSQQTFIFLLCTYLISAAVFIEKFRDDSSLKETTSLGVYIYLEFTKVVVIGSRGNLFSSRFTLKTILSPSGQRKFACMHTEGFLCLYTNFQTSLPRASQSRNLAGPLRSRLHAALPASNLG